MEETGIVLTAEAGQATLRMTDNAACGSCSQSASCHTGSGEERVLAVSDPIGVRPGQEVTVEVPVKGLATAMGLAYGFPLILLFLGAVIGYRMGEGDAELASAFGALAGLGLAFVILRRYRALYEGRLSVRPVIIRVGAVPRV